MVTRTRLADSQGDMILPHINCGSYQPNISGRNGDEMNADNDIQWLILLCNPSKFCDHRLKICMKVFSHGLVCDMLSIKVKS